MWINTDNDGLINLDKAERIAIVDEINIHVFRTGGELLVAFQYPSPKETEDAYEAIQIQVGIKAAPLSASAAAVKIVKALPHRR
jgi:hypothetical protein